MSERLTARIICFYLRSTFFYQIIIMTSHYRTRRDGCDKSTYYAATSCFNHSLFWPDERELKRLLYLFFLKRHSNVIYNLESEINSMTIQNQVSTVTICVIKCIFQHITIDATWIASGMLLLLQSSHHTFIIHFDVGLLFSWTEISRRGETTRNHYYYIETTLNCTLF